MDLSIITISRNMGMLSSLLKSIANSKHNLNLEVLCAWNGKENIKKNISLSYGFPIKIHYLKQYHFSSNNNILAEKANGRVLLFLNDDIVLVKDCLQNAWKAFQYPDVGIVGANLRYPNGRIQHAGVYFSDDGTPFHQYKNKLDYRDQKLSITKSVPAVTGAFILIGKEEFLKIKFDESFRIAGKDIALCLKYRSLINKEIVYVATAKAIHYENATRRLTRERLNPKEDLNLIKKLSKVSKSSKINQRYPKIRIVTEQSGWILHRMSSEIQKNIKNVKINEVWPDADIHYYFNYGYYQRRHQME
ncbi:glycosyltransferase [Halalkalibacter kiskunsagensis]|uniref:Glycosyltransferase n=1 Tax=Halalkalibacter kiskunsagensis TaxID=1548599 RepID=A0ABV6KAI9_9BACI